MTVHKGRLLLGDHPRHLGWRGPEVGTDVTRGHRDLGRGRVTHRAQGRVAHQARGGVGGHLAEMN